MIAEHSRAVLLARGVSRHRGSELEAALESSRIVVSADPMMPMFELTLRVLLTTLRRGPGALVLDRTGLPDGLVDELTAAVAAIDPERPLETAPGRNTSATVRLHVGPTADRSIRLVPEGFGAHVAGSAAAVIRPGRPGNAVGAVYTAALGAAEAFKWTARVVPARRILHRHLRFCPLTLAADLAAAPELPAGLMLELALIGVGAIGTGVVLLLDAIEARGRLLAVDRQRLGPENRGTYSLGGEAEVRSAPWKADLAAAALPRFDVIPFRQAVQELPAAVDAGTAPWFPEVITALDSAEARRDAQRLWADRLIDAGTGDTMLGMHAVEHGAGPCLICFFPPNYDGPSAAERLAEATGLSIDRAMRGDDPLSPEDLEGLTVEQRARLASHLGKPVCGLALPFGLTALEGDGYQPSIPFVSLQAACLAVSRMVAHRLAWPVQGNLVQYDALFGPQAATIETMLKRSQCTCQTRSDTIERVRARRSSIR